AGDARHGLDRGAHRGGDLLEDVALRGSRREMNRDAGRRDLDVLHHPEGHDVAGEAGVGDALQRLQDCLRRGHPPRLATAPHSTVSRWENGHVKPSKLAWKALEQLAAERGSPLMDDPGGV